MTTVAIAALVDGKENSTMTSTPAPFSKSSSSSVKRIGLSIKPPTATTTSTSTTLVHKPLLIQQRKPLGLLQSKNNATVPNQQPQPTASSPKKISIVHPQNRQSPVKVMTVPLLRPTTTTTTTTTTTATPTTKAEQVVPDLFPAISHEQTVTTQLLAPIEPAVVRTPSFKYSRETLLQMRDLEVCKKKPEGMVDLPLIALRRVIKIIKVRVKKTTELETDEHRIAQRKKQIDYGRNTAGFKQYFTLVPIEFRMKIDPIEPNPLQQCSKRSWDGQIRKWRRRLHFYDDAKTLDDVKVARCKTVNIEAVAKIEKSKKRLAAKLQQIQKEKEKAQQGVVAGAVVQATTAPTHCEDGDSSDDDDDSDNDEEIEVEVEVEEFSAPQ